MATGHKVSIPGYRWKDGKLIPHQPKLNASAAIARRKKPRSRYVGGAKCRT
jgi:hypothetical protein